MVNAEKYHGFYSKLERYLDLSEDDIKNVPLINLSNFVKKNIPEVYNEMISQERFKKWIADDIDACLIDVIKYEGKKVGFIAYDVGNQIRTINIAKIYILEEYRGKGIFGQYLYKLQDWKFNKLKQNMNKDFIIEISEPNLYTIKSLLKSEMIIPLPDAPIYMGIGILFSIPLAKKIDGKSKVCKSKICTTTPFYSVELASPVGIVNDTLVYSGMSFIDEEDFNVSVTRNELLNNPKKKEDLKELLMTLMTALGNIALQEVGDCSDMYERA